MQAIASKPVMEGKARLNRHAIPDHTVKTLATTQHNLRAMRQHAQIRFSWIFSTPLLCAAREVFLVAALE